jgi:Ca2+/Na+ antiporter
MNNIINFLRNHWKAMAIVLIILTLAIFSCQRKISIHPVILAILLFLIVFIFYKYICSHRKEDEDGKNILLLIVLVGELFYVYLLVYSFIGKEHIDDFFSKVNSWFVENNAIFIFPMVSVFTFGMVLLYNRSAFRGIRRKPIVSLLLSFGALVLLFIYILMITSSNRDIAVAIYLAAIPVLLAFWSIYQEGRREQSKKPETSHPISEPKRHIGTPILLATIPILLAFWLIKRESRLKQGKKPENSRMTGKRT